MDDFDEEETLEGAADLGTMIREMSIDQITRPADADAETDVDSDEEDYEDFEEEDSIDDQIGDDSKTLKTPRKTMPTPKTQTFGEELDLHPRARRRAPPPTASTTTPPRSTRPRT